MSLRTAINTARFLLISSLLGFGPLAAATFIEVKKTTETHARLVLPNGLEALLISNPQFTKASASLTIPVGAWSDPEEHQGLAHFLEHMLFLGTKEYPTPGEYQDFISNNGGQSNAYTSFERTAYHFEVNTPALNEGLKRFSRFFVSPILDPQYAEKERNAVNSEFDMNLQDDSWRVWRMVGLIAPEGHPNRKFNIGSRDTLAKADDKILRDFYNQHYSSDNMKLTILSSLPVAQLRKMVEANFADVPNRKLAGKEFLKDLPARAGGQWLEIKSINDTNKVRLQFNLPAFGPRWIGQPQLLLTDILGSEREGTPAYILKKKNLITSLNVSTDDLVNRGEDAGFLIVDIDLTTAGEDQLNEVIATVTSYIGELRRQGIKKYLYDEIRTMRKLAFENRGAVEGMDEAARYASEMQVHPALQINERTLLVNRTNPTLVETYLARMNAKSLTIIRQSQTAKTDQKEEIFGIEYSMKPIPPELVARIDESLQKPVVGLLYPEPNPWIPKNLDLRTDRPTEQPTALEEDARGKIWIKQESGTVAKPLAFATLQLASPAPSATLRNVVLMAIYAKAFSLTQQPRLYPFGQAGFTIGLDASARGMVFKINGYSDNFAEVVKDVIANPKAKLSEIKLSEEELEAIKEQLTREYANEKQKGAIENAIAYYNYMVENPAFWVSEYENEVASITADEVARFAQEFFRQVYIEGLVYGNVTASDFKGLSGQIVNLYQSQPMAKQEIDRILADQQVLPPAKKFVAVMTGENNNHALFTKVDLGVRTDELAAQNAIVGALVEREYYNQLRTEQQLGYVVQASARNTALGTHLIFLVQSAEYSANEINARSNTFMQKFLKDSPALLTQNFETVRQAQIVELSRKPATMADRNTFLQTVLLTRNGDWEINSRAAESLKTVKVEDVQTLINRVFDLNQQSRLSILYHAKGAAVPTPANGEILVEGKADYAKKRAE